MTDTEVETPKEIEITPEMVEAGTAVLYAADYRFESHEDVVKEIFVSVFRIHLLLFEEYHRSQ